MKLSKIAKQIIEHEKGASVTLSQTKDGTWFARHFRAINGKNMVHTKTYKSLSIDLPLIKGKNFKTLPRSISDKDGTYYPLEGNTSKYINIYFYKNLFTKKEL